MTFKPVHSLPNPYLAHLQKQVEHQRLGLQRLRQALPDVLKAHASHCVISGNKLILYTDSAIWGSQLRFYQNDLLTAMASFHGLALHSLQVRILNRRVGVESLPDTKPLPPSTEVVELIRNLGDQTADVELKTALRKLSETLAKK